MKLFLLLLTTTVAATAAASKRRQEATCLRQADFENGTVIITKPGNYKLCEDIVFNPNAPPAGELPADVGKTACDPVFPDYDENAFGLGFFSAIAIASHDVTLFLNRHTIEQSDGFALMQRFFAIIELANAPFIAGAGPAQFVGANNTLSPASNILIAGPGTLGRSAHHGIHGNDNKNVRIRNVKFQDFEVAAVSLNNVDNLVIRGCHVIRNRHDVPVVGLFSAARNLRPYGKVLKDKKYQMKLRGVVTSAEEVYDKLIDSINNVYSDVILGNGTINKTAHPEEYELFHNPFGAIDGPCYAFVVHGKGPAVGGQGENFNWKNDTVTSSNIVIRDNNISNITCWTNEVPAAVGDAAAGKNETTVTNDVRGAVFQFVSTYNRENHQLAINADGTYKGNVVADMQMMVAKAIEDGVLEDTPLHQTGTNTINPMQTAWAMNESAIYEPKYRCNGDSMHHVSKGTIVIRVEDSKGFVIRNNIIRNVTNLSPTPFSNCDDYHQGASQENLKEQQGGNVRAISVAAVRAFAKKGKRTRRSLVWNNDISEADSENANVIIGIDVQGYSKGVKIGKNKVDLKSGVGHNSTDKYIGLRIREFASSSGRNAITLHKNDLKQEKQVLNDRRRQLLEGDDALMELHHHGHMSGDIEWYNGGCPFARGSGMIADEL